MYQALAQELNRVILLKACLLPQGPYSVMKEMVIWSVVLMEGDRGGFWLWSEDRGRVSGVGEGVGNGDEALEEGEGVSLAWDQGWLSHFPFCGQTPHSGPCCFSKLPSRHPKVSIFLYDPCLWDQKSIFFFSPKEFRCQREDDLKNKCHSYMWNLKRNETNELTKQKKETQTLRRRLWLLGGGDAS